MSKFLIGEQVLFDDSFDLQSALRHAHAEKLRPKCLCTDPGRPMYVAQIHDLFVVKRMPHTGSTHDPRCPSFESPMELSGLGELAGHAIQEDAETGVTLLRLDFSLTKHTGRTAPVQAENADTVRTDGSRLTLRGLLHYLWDQAGLVRWVPGMAGKRNWYVVRRALLESAASMVARATPLPSTLLIPEPFFIERKAEIARARTAQLEPLTRRTESGAHRLMVLVGEVKELAPARYGHRMVIKHLPDMPLMLTSGLFRHLEKRFAKKLALWSTHEDTHLIAACTFGMGITGVGSIEQTTLVLMSAQWLPVEHAQELTLIRTLCAHGRRFTKSLRYNLEKSRPVASAVLTDTDDPTALFIAVDDAAGPRRESFTELIDQSDVRSWIWLATDVPMPELPPARQHPHGQ